MIFIFVKIKILLNAVFMIIVTTFLLLEQYKTFIFIHK